MAISSNRLLVFNLRTDIDDHILGFTSRWLNELAQYYDYIDVLTTHRGRLALADHITVYSTGREAGLNRPQQLARFYGTLAQLLHKHHYSACFAHMQPMFAVLAAPLLQAYGVRTTTWYTHRQLTGIIRLAERCSYRIVSAVESSFPLASPKLRPLGHGIDTDFFTPDARPSAEPPRIVQVARLTPIKKQHLLIQAIADLECQLVLVGDVPDGYDDGYKRELHTMVQTRELEMKVIFAGAQAPSGVLDHYRRATLAINLSPPGLFDKAALESMSCAIPTLVSNSAFVPLLNEQTDHLLIQEPEHVAKLSQMIGAMIECPAPVRRRIGEQLRQQIIKHHSLKTLIPKLITVMHNGELP